MEYNFFFGSNTAFGFKGAYEHILSADRLIILKGGAGTGKSTLMKKVAAAATSLNYDTEIYHCSSDAASLDSVYIPGLNCAVVDGTAPHVIEASLPSVKHFVFNLTDCTDSKKLTASRLTVENLVKHKKLYFNKAYCHLKCAYTLQRYIDNILLEHVDNDSINAVASKIFSLVGEKNGNVASQKLLSAITNKGVISYCVDNCRNETCYAISCEYPAVSSLVLERVKLLLAVANVTCTQFISPFDFERLEGVRVGDITIVHSAIAPAEAINVEADVLRKFNRNTYEDFTPLINAHVSNAIENLNYAHLSHGEIEKLYYPAMDWADINGKTEKIIDLLFN